MSSSTMMAAIPTARIASQGGAVRAPTLRRSLGAMIRGTTARLTDADPDKDGAIRRSGMHPPCKTLSASPRGRLRRRFDRADADRDSSVAAAELRGQAEIDAQRAISENRGLARRTDF
jgi:hypothetical protein